MVSKGRNKSHKTGLLCIATIIKENSYLRCITRPVMKSNCLPGKITAVIIGFSAFLPCNVTADQLDSLEMLLKDKRVDSDYVETQLAVSRLYHREKQHGDRCIQLASVGVQHAVNIGNTFLYAKALDNL